MVIAALVSAALSIANPGISMADILAVTDIAGLSASPDGRWVAFRTTRPRAASDDYDISWYVMPSRGGEPPRRIASGGQMLFNEAGLPADPRPVWAPGSGSFYFRALVGDEVQLWRATLDGEQPTMVTHDPSDIRDFRLSSDGRAIIYQVGATRAALAIAERRNQDEGVLVDASVDLAQPLARGGLIDGKPGSERLTGDWFSRGDLLWRTPTRDVRFALPDQDRAVVGSGFSGRAIRTTISPDYKLSATIGRGRAVACRTSQCLTGRVWTAVPVPGGDRILVTNVDRAARETLSLWRPGSRRGRTIARSDGFLNGGREPDATCAAVRGAAICVEATGISPPRLVRVPFSGRHPETLFDPNASLRARTSVQAEQLEWTSSDGTIFTGTLILPPRDPPPGGYPLVLNYYACYEYLRGGFGDELPIQPLAEAGIATLCANRTWAVAGQTQPSAWDYDHAIAGIEAAVDRLAERGLVDRRRVGISGLSYGSEIAYQALWRLPWLAAAAASTGTLDPAFYWYYALPGRNTAATMRRAWNVGPPNSDEQGWARISPLAHAEEIHVPLLMQLPEQEARWSTEFHARLANSGTPIELYAYPNESHVKRRPRHNLAAYQRNYDWFRFWLQGVVDRSPEKTDQYERWIAMARRQSKR